MQVLEKRLLYILFFIWTIVDNNCTTPKVQTLIVNEKKNTVITEKIYELDNVVTRHTLWLNIGIFYTYMSRS